ncbi:hypothetical protein BASA50_002781 [Batrachochytrium salamandrivorans]|uniref:Exoribonuclease phosphorolytic domain-containing protein n=1 Tax=Batrachochytrium salamandrivorans TaxID=1357716 RepID=A0ABQ8FK98_9FUNG|nr:hypothetical protein BASA60_008487 [Batrachochytrium salamandrivorans]KAH6570644.1 hypothetical protein BASA62_004222 [Batrachochytrium salamandrivorans]KAH6580571.1 hypothetical protein BASA61_009583 [Batrachochytrium salamandrivorans]KAH6599756.1 hypothetical protein BASA50_002781 [Batrachochytrium salamandrivorans]KAH9252710.1 hypothetical protein BASA81_009313 [Batrachochytrium salamandrivorans]
MDRRRISGPEKSIVPKQRTTAAPSNPQNGQRLDKRRADQVRPIFTKTGIVTQANGSAYMETGNLKVICSIYGPRQSASKQYSSSALGSLQCDFKFATFSGEKRKGYIKDSQEKEFSMVLEQALTPAVRLEMYPKSTIQAFVIVLENDGVFPSLAAAISCTSLALANAGIEMLDVVTASSAGFFGSVVGLDPTFQEEKVQNGAMLLSYMPSINEVTHLIQSGETTVPQSVKAVELCVDACSQIHTVILEALLSE